MSIPNPASRLLTTLSVSYGRQSVVSKDVALLLVHLWVNILQAVLWSPPTKWAFPRQITQILNMSRPNKRAVVQDKTWSATTTGMQLHESLPDCLLCHVGSFHVQSHITLWVDRCTPPAPVIGTHALTAHLDAGCNVLPLTQHFSRRLLQDRQHNQLCITEAKPPSQCSSIKQGQLRRVRFMHCACGQGHAA